MPTARNLTQTERLALLHFFLERLDGDTLERGALAEAHRQFGYSKPTLTILWKKWVARRAASETNEWDVTSDKKGNGSGPKYDPEELQATVLDMRCRRRRTVRALASGLQISKSHLHRMIKKEGILIPHSSTLKPKLTEYNKLERVDFCLSERSDNDIGRYRDMYNRVHVDEKWFYITKVKDRYYLVPGEAPPERTTSHKNHIPKVMFLCAVARPRFDPGRNQWFDGKIGMWPIAEQVPAARASVNRPAGTLEWKNLKVTKAVYTQYLVEKVLPAIRERFPHTNRPIYIQQDNATSHLKPEEFATLLAGYPAGNGNWRFVLYCQPPNSPDMNVLDLGFFRALQGLQFEEPSENTGVLIARVLRCFAVYPSEKLNRIFVTLQSCLNEIINCDGGNQYKIPHMNKERLERLGQLPVSLAVTEDAQYMWGAEEGDEEEDEEEDDEEEEEEGCNM
jgi:hypothetical protein